MGNAMSCGIMGLSGEVNMTYSVLVDRTKTDPEFDSAVKAHISLLKDRRIGDPHFILEPTETPAYDDTFVQSFKRNPELEAAYKKLLGIMFPGAWNQSYRTP